MSISTTLTQIEAKGHQQRLSDCCSCSFPVPQIQSREDESSVSSTLSLLTVCQRWLTGVRAGAKTTRGQECRAKNTAACCPGGAKLADCTYEVEAVASRRRLEPPERRVAWCSFWQKRLIIELRSNISPQIFEQAAKLQRGLLFWEVCFHAFCCGLTGRASRASFPQIRRAWIQ